MQTISLADRDREIRIVKVLSGDQGWFQVPARDGSGTRTIDLDGERLQTLKDEAHAIPLPNLLTYLDENHTLSSLEPTDVNGKPADGVLVKSKNHDEIKLWFDRETGLLAKQEHRTRLISDQAETLQENIYGEYHDRDGVKNWNTVRSRLDGGDRVFEGTLATLELEPKLGENAFAQPDE